MQRQVASAIRTALATARLDELPALIAAHDSDERSGVVAALASARRRLKLHAVELERLERLARPQLDLNAAGFMLVAGVDEVGRGALAGPVSVGAVLLPADARILGINDSKKLTPSRRVELDARIRAVATAASVAHVEPHVIDRIGIDAAVSAAARSALDALGLDIDHVLADGRIDRLGRATTCVIKGDSSVACIAAASIIAKVERDALMRELDVDHPGYRFAGNKGYGCPAHLAALETLGPSPIHRLSFAPCSQRRVLPER